MVVLFATMGYTPSLVVAPLRQHRDIVTLHLFYGGGRDPKRREALDSVRKVAKTFSVALVEHEVEDGFDYDAALRAFGDARAGLDEQPLLFNASSGPRPMIMAATIFCFTHDVPLVYYDEYDTREGKQIPLRAYGSLRGMSDAKRSLLQRVQKHGPTDVGTLAKKLKLATSTVSEHVKELVQEGVLVVDREGRRRVVRLGPGVDALNLGAVA